MSQGARSSRNIAFFILIFLIVPFSLGYNPKSSLLDFTFIYMSNFLFKAGFIYGKDVFFTHGPLGFLLNPLSDGGLYSTALLFHGVVFLAAVLMTVTLMRRLAVSIPQTLIFVAALFFGSYFAWLPTSSTLLLYLALASCVFLSVFRGNKGVTLFLNAFFLFTSLLLLVKFNAFILFFALSVCFTATLFFSKTMRASTALLLCGLLIVETAAAYLLYNPSFSDLWRYIGVSLEIASHYSIAHSLPLEWADILPSLLLGLFILLYLALFSRADKNLAFLAVPLCIILFFSFKHAFIRADSTHVPIIFQCLTFTAAWLILLSRNAPAFIASSAIVAATLSCALFPSSKAFIHDGIQEVFQNYQAESIFATAAEAFAPQKSGLRIIEYLSRKPHLLGAPRFVQESPMLDAAMAKDIRGRSVSSLFSTLPLLLEIDANRVRFKPFPVYETYSAYSRRLDDKTAALLEDPREAPQYILYAAFDIDEKCPATTTPRTFFALYDHYDLAEYPTAYCFRLRKHPRFKTIFELSRMTTAPDRRIIPPPHGGELLASFHLRLNIFGKLLSILGAVPEISLLIKPEGADIVARRIAPDAMNNPCLLRGAIFGADLKGFFQDQGAKPGIEYVAISGEGAKYLETPFEATFHQTEPR